jgi:hypothetical protein
MPIQAVAGGRYRILVGQTIAGFVWSNTAFTLEGQFTIVYDNGEKDRWIVPSTASGSSRAGVIWQTGRVTKDDGWVVDGYITGHDTIPAQRGQAFVGAFVVPAPVAQGQVFTGWIGSGYVYNGHAVGVGEITEPGPAGGQGAITRVTKAATAVGGATGLVLAAVPTGAQWRWIAGFSKYQASATVGTRTIEERFRDASGNFFLESTLLSPTVNQAAEFEFGPGFGFATASLLGGNLTAQFPSPDRGLPAGYDLFVVDPAAIDAADTATLEAQVEEWVMPN